MARIVPERKKSRNRNRERLDLVTGPTGRPEGQEWHIKRVLVLIGPWCSEGEKAERNSRDEELKRERERE